MTHTQAESSPLAGVALGVVEDRGFKEDAVREVIILPILSALGYGVSGPNRLVRSRTLVHPILKVGSKKRKVTYIPDYVLEKSGAPFCVLDAKAPTEAILTGEHVEQVYSYAIHPEIRAPFYAVCNGREFVLFRVDNDRPELTFSLSELERYWPLLQSYLSVREVRNVGGGLATLPTVPRVDGFEYRKIKPPEEITRFQKQAAKRHFGVHGYFTKQIWSVVSTYIKTFTQPGDVVLDPYGGSGVTIIEALMGGRKGIHIDLNPLSEFIVRVLLQPVHLADLVQEFNKIVQQFAAQEPKTDAEIAAALKKYPYPQGIRLPKTSDVEFIEQLFSPRQIAHLALLKHLIMKVKRDDIREALLLMFSGLLNKINLT